MKGVLPFLIALGVLLLGPVLLHEKAGKSGEQVDETLVIISPHNEATRYEFGRGFREAYFAKTGKRVLVDWRSVGGTSEIVRYVAAQYAGSFRNYWTGALGRAWTPGCGAFDDPKATGDGAAARDAFLKSNAGCGIDLFFGGGSFDFIQMAAAGRLVDSGIVKGHPELFGGAGGIPRMLGGETLWDTDGRWVGACVSAFGICYNVDSLARLGIARAPEQWADLADVRYADELALADLTQSGSVGKAFEMIIQQQIVAGLKPGQESDQKMIADGWERGLRLIERISANARYFTDSATEIPFSVETGDAAAGMCIDFYGRFESEAVRRGDGTSRMMYVTPRGGSSTGADSIGMFRGAPHAELARAFIEYVTSPEGQNLWCYRAGTPGGPEKYALRRLPIRPDMYGAEFRQYEADPDVAPYAGGAVLDYHAAWTGSLLRVMSVVIRTAFIDPHDELRDAWKALVEAGFPPEATKVFADMTAVDYAAASGRIRDTMRSANRLDEVALERELDEHFKEQYREAGELARRGR